MDYARITPKVLQVIDFISSSGALSGHFPKFAVSLLFPSFPYFFFNFIGGCMTKGDVYGLS